MKFKLSNAYENGEAYGIAYFTGKDQEIELIQSGPFTTSSVAIDVGKALLKKDEDFYVLPLIVVSLSTMNEVARITIRKETEVITTVTFPELPCQHPFLKHVLVERSNRNPYNGFYASIDKPGNYYCFDGCKFRAFNSFEKNCDDLYFPSREILIDRIDKYLRNIDKALSNKQIEIDSCIYYNHNWLSSDGSWCHISDTLKIMASNRCIIHHVTDRNKAIELIYRSGLPST